MPCPPLFGCRKILQIYMKRRLRCEQNHRWFLLSSLYANLNLEELKTTLNSCRTLHPNTSRPAIAKFIVPYWGTKSTIAYGWRTDPPALCSLCCSQLYPPVMDYKLGLWAANSKNYCANSSASAKVQVANGQWMSGSFFLTNSNHVVKHWGKWYWKKGGDPRSGAWRD